MKKQSVYILAWTLITTWLVAFATFASTPSSTTPTDVKLPSAISSTGVKDTEVNDSKEASSKDEGSKEINDDSGVVLPANSITEAQASQVVLTANSGAKVIWISTENENWTIVFNVALDNKSEVKVDAVKGIILKTDKSDEKDNEKDTNNDSDGWKNED